MTESEKLRRAELDKLKTLTDAEMQELISLSPPDRFKKLPNAFTLGIVNLEQAIANLNDGAARSKHAYQNGCFIEVISLQLQYLDYWLRVFWVARNQKGKIFEPDDKRSFGALLTDCERLGFDPGLVKRMREFNAARVDSIHKYLLGSIRYEQLKVVCDDYKGLTKEVQTYTASTVGTPGR